MSRGLPPVVQGLTLPDSSVFTACFVARRSPNCSEFDPSAALARWVVYCKPPSGGPEQVLRYIGAYTHRVAISNRRLVSFLDDKVTFRRDSARKNKSDS
jgi:hypothetical protein